MIVAVSSYQDFVFFCYYNFLFFNCPFSFSGAGSPEMLTSKVNWSPALHLISFKLVLSILGGTFLALHVTGQASLDGSLCPPALIAFILNS